MDNYCLTRKYVHVLIIVLIDAVLDRALSNFICSNPCVCWLFCKNKRYIPRNRMATISQTSVVLRWLLRWRTKSYLTWLIFETYVSVYYCQISNIKCTIVGNKIANHTDAVGATSVGVVQTSSLFTTSHLHSPLILEFWLYIMTTNLFPCHHCQSHISQLKIALRSISTTRPL